MQLDRPAPPWTDRLASQFRCPNAVEAAVFRLWLRSVLVRSNANGWSSGVQFRTTTRIELIVRAPSEAAFVNQALAEKLPGLDPSGFNPHAFARSGLRAPLTSGLWPARRPAGRLTRPSTFTRWFIIIVR